MFISVYPVGLSRDMTRCISVLYIRIFYLSRPENDQEFKTSLCTIYGALHRCNKLRLAGHYLIDVRTADEFRQQSVYGAVNIPYEEIDAGITKLGLEKDSAIYLYCKSGRRAGIAKASLDALGFTAVMNVGGLEAALAEAEKAQPSYPATVTH
jgi:phage shock protein E